MSGALRRAAAAGAMLVVAACAGTGNAPVVRNGGTIFVALPADPPSLNPLVARDAASLRAYAPLFPLLYAAQPDLSVGPDLASALPVYSDGGRTLTVSLRADAKWSDGMPVTADDVVYTISTELNPHLQTAAPFDWAPLAGVAKVDAHTVRLTLTRADAAFLADDLVTPIVPQHALASVDPAHMAAAPFSRAPTVTCGPFRFNHRSAGHAVFLDANPSYYQGRPHADHVVEQVSTDADAATQLGEGSLSWDPELTATAAAAAVTSSGVTVSSYADNTIVAVQFNVRTGHPFADAALRQAFALSIDHDAVVSSASAAAQGISVADGINPASWANPGITTYRHDVAHAKQLLGGRSPAAAIVYPASDGERAAAAALLAQQANAAGFMLTVDGLGDAAFAAALSSGAFEVALVDINTGIDPDESNVYATGGSQNWGGYTNPSLDALVAAELAAVPTTSATLQQLRKSTLQQIERIVSNDLPLYFLWAPRHFMGFSATLGGVSAVGVHLDADRSNSFYLDWFLTA